MGRFTEVTTLSRDKVDAESGIIHGVKLLGHTSRNGRRYTNEAVRSAVGKYDGTKVYLNHPRRDNAGDDRPFQDWVGKVQSPAVRDDGIYGDIKLRKESAHFKGIIEAAKDFPGDVGFSHVADGQSHMSGDTEIVESINEVLSVDLVTEPATTNGFFESMQTKITLRQAVEKLPASSPFRSQLIEGMDGGLFDGDMPLSDCGDQKTSDPLTLIYNALTKVLDALVKVTGQKEMAATNANTTQQQPPNTPPADDVNKPANKLNTPPPGVGDNTDPTKQQYESRIASLERKLALADAKAVLTESGIEATDIRVATYINTPAEHRTALLESWPKQEAKQQPASDDSFWPTISPPAKSSDNGGAVDSKYVERFAEASKRAKEKLRSRSHN